MTSFPDLFAAGWDGPLPDPDADDGPCELTGSHGPRVAWRPKPSWTAHSTHAAPGEGAVSVGCALLMDGGPDPDHPRRRWTMYSLAAKRGERSQAAQRDRLHDISRWVNTGWSVCLVDQGKRHTAYLTPVTDGSELCVALDGHAIRCAWGVWRPLAARIEAAYRAGVSKTRLGAGALSVGDHHRLGVTEARELHDLIRPLAGTPTLRLAAWLATKEDS